MNDLQFPRGIASIDTKDVKVRWRARGGLLPGESGITPAIDEGAMDLPPARIVDLPHKWSEKDIGIGVYSTEFSLSLPRATSPTGVRIRHAPQKALIYLNGTLIGRYWESVGPQKLFYLMPPFINPGGKNRLTIACWPWQESPSLGPVTLEVYP